jgi:hypothetical protein
MPKSKSIWTLALAGLTVLAAAACVGDSKPAPGTSGNPAPSQSSTSSSSSTESSAPGSVLDVIAAQASPGTYAFDTAGVEQLAAGEVKVTLTNGDSDGHEARIIRVNDGNVSAYLAALRTGGPTGVATLGTEVGATGSTSPGESTTTTVTLDPGFYVIVDLLPAPDGKVFAQEGLARELRVVA